MFSSSFFYGVNDIFAWANIVLSPTTIPSYQRCLKNQSSSYLDLDIYGIFMEFLDIYGIFN